MLLDKRGLGSKSNLNIIGNGYLSLSLPLSLTHTHTHKDPKLKHKSFPYHDVNHYPSPLKPNLTKNPYDQAKQIIVINQIIKSKSFPTTKSSFVEQQNKTCINVAI